MTSVLITGTSKGIGLATAVAMGRAGHKVYATMRNPSVDPAALNYPQERRFSGLFTESLKTPAPPSIVAEKILDVATGAGNDWQLRHPVGPDAVPFLEWRSAMSDEEWTEWGALNDDDWYARVEADFGLDARQA